MPKRRSLALLGVIGLVVAAVAQELGKPPEERTWQGRLAGFIPYDFRSPTFERFRRAWWNPSDHRILTETPLGVGWTLNLGRLAQVLAAAGTAARQRMTAD